jgi:ATP phosphoribosyltransferase
MPETTRRFCAEHGLAARVFTSHGATEAKIPDIVDAIVDLTETGSSLRKAGLKIIETLLSSKTELLANRASFDDPDKRAAMDDIVLLVHGALLARGKVLLKLNVASAQLQPVLDVLPSMASPTVMPLADGELRAVEAVVAKQGVNTLIPALKAAGARDILEIPIAKIVE